jgi:hypothetical protein
MSSTHFWYTLNRDRSRTDRTCSPRGKGFLAEVDQAPAERTRPESRASSLGEAQHDPPHVPNLQRQGPPRRPHGRLTSLPAVGFVRCSLEGVDSHSALCGVEGHAATTAPRGCMRSGAHREPKDRANRGRIGIKPDQRAIRPLFSSAPPHRTDRLDMGRATSVFKPGGSLEDVLRHSGESLVVAK